MAGPDEGPLVQRLVAQADGPAWDWLDWTNVYPYWLIGDVDGVPEGTVMVQPGMPFGRLECLCVNPTLSHRQKALLVRDLCYAGIATCKQMGSQAVFSMIDHNELDWLALAIKRGWSPFQRGTILVKKV